MEICERCGKHFDLDFDELEFDANSDTFPLIYSNVHPCLCADCALEALENKEEDVFFLSCDRCGKVFDYILDSGKFLSLSGAMTLDGAWHGETLCCDCAWDDASLL